MKSIFKFALLMGVSAMCLAGVTSCSDDDDELDGDTITNTGSDTTTNTDTNTDTEDEGDTAEDAMKAIVEQYVPNVIYAIYEDLAEESKALYELLAAANAKGVDNLVQTDIDEICAMFLQARQSWEESEAFLYGAATDFAIDPHIDTWPLDLDALAISLSNEAQMAQLEGEDGIIYAGAKLGAELLGFHGIEYIIFRDGANRDVEALKAGESINTDQAGAITVTGETELIYATAVAGDLRDNCYRLLCSWDADADSEYMNRCEELEYALTVGSGSKSYGENMLSATNAGSTYETWQEACSTILIGGCSNIANEVANVKMGNAHSGEDVNYIESPYSHKSFQDFIDNMLSIQYTLYGESGATSAGENSLMAFFETYGYSGASTLESALSSAISAIEDCQAKGAFVEIYADDSVQTAMDAVNALDTELNKAAAWIVLQ